MIVMSRDSIDTLLNFIDRSPSPYHTVAASKKLLDEAGFTALVPEETLWQLKADRATTSRSTDRASSPSGRAGISAVICASVRPTPIFPPFASSSGRKSAKRAI